jgi:hypothetical protein
MDTHPALHSKDSDIQSLHDLPSSRSSSLTNSGRVAGVGAHNGSVTTIKALDLHGHARQESIDSQLSAYSTYSDRILNRPLYADSTNLSSKSRNNHNHITTNPLRDSDNSTFNAHRRTQSARLILLDSPVILEDAATYNERKRVSVQPRSLEFDEYTAYGSSPFSDYNDLVSVPTNATGLSPRSVSSWKQSVAVEEKFNFNDCDSPLRLASSMAYGNEVFDSSNDVINDSTDASQRGRASPLLPVNIIENGDTGNESSPLTSTRTPPSSDHDQRPGGSQTDQKNDIDSIIVHPARAGIPHVFRLRNLDTKVQSETHKNFNTRSVYIPVYISGGSVRSGDGANTVFFPWRNAQDHEILVPTVRTDQTLSNISAYKTAAPSPAAESSTKSTSTTSPKTFHTPDVKKHKISIGEADDFQTPKFSFPNIPMSDSKCSSSLGKAKIDDSNRLTTDNSSTVSPDAAHTRFQPMVFLKESIDRLSTTLLPSGNKITAGDIINTPSSNCSPTLPQDKSKLMTPPPLVLKAQTSVLPPNTYVTSPLADRSTSQLGDSLSDSLPLANSNLQELISNPQHCARDECNLPQTPPQAYATQERNNSADEIKTFANHVQRAQQTLNNTDNELMNAAEIAQALLDQKTTGCVWATPALPVQPHIFTTTEIIANKLPLVNAVSTDTHNSQHIRLSSDFSASAYSPKKDHSTCLPQSDLVNGSRSTEHFLLLAFSLFPPLWLLLGFGSFDGFIVARQGAHTVVRSDQSVHVVAGASRRTKTLAFVFASAFFLAAITGLIVGLAVGLT